MQDIRQETLNECTRAEQSACVVLWEIDLTEVGGERYFFCNEQNEKGEPVTWQGRQYQPYPIQGSGFELNGKGTSTRPTLTVSNLYGMVTGMAEDLQSLVGGTVVRRKVYARFLDAVNFVNGNSDADPEQEVISRWRIEQCSELSAVSASLYCPRRRKRMVLFFRGASCWLIPAPGPIAVMSAVITVRLSRMNMTSLHPISRRINAANA
ncbi:phage minor tail protein [Escherichia coli]|nr:phage minor tail protein [Escherichia coli]